MNRRQFCFGAMSSLFLNSLLQDSFLSLCSSAYATPTSGIVKNYIVFWMDGAPERSWFDGVLTPNGSNDFLGKGAGVYTAPSSAQNLNVWENKTTNSKVNGKFYLPFLWDSILPGLSGNFSMSDLAKNVAIMRGVNTGLTFDAHAHNALRMQVPIPKHSLIGDVADNSENVFVPAIMSSGSFTSNRNKVAAKINVTANAKAIFEALEFINSNGQEYSSAPSKVMGLKKMDNVVASFIDSLHSQMPNRKKKTLEIMMDNRSNVINLIGNGFGTLERDYVDAFNRYSSLINQVMNPSGDRILKGFDDINMVGTGTAFQFSNSEEGRYWDFNVIEGFKNAECSHLAHSFAKAEIYLKNNITNCMQLEIGGAVGAISRIYEKYSNEASAKSFGFDCHFTGQVLRGVAFTRYYQSFGACLNNFKHQLGSKWDETLVHVRSEFNRGTAHLRGSDHNINSCIETFFSGSIKDGPMVMGDIKYNNNSLCEGSGIPVAEVNNEMIDSKHIYSTVGTLMGYEPSRNHKSALVVKDGKITQNYPNPKNKEAA